MGYRAEKLKIENKIKILKWVGLCILVLLMIALAIWDAFCPIASWKYYFSKPKIEKRKAGEMRIHFLDVGQGDSILIELPDGKVMLIDGGNNQDSTKKTVMRFLNALEIDVIDYLVVTHADADHCGSLEEVFAYKTVLNAYMPASSEVEDEYAETYAKALESGCNMHLSSRAIDLSAKDGATPYTLSFIYPYTAEVDDSGSLDQDEEERNESSAVIWLDYKGTSALFTGDVSVEVEEKLLQDASLGLLDGSGVRLESTEILKVGHHGSKTSTSAAFLEYLHIQTAVISCGKGNIYGHPTNEVLTRLQNVGASIYRTDEKGFVTLTASADGTYSVKTKKN